MGDKFAKVSDIQEILDKALHFIDKEIREKLYMIMDYNNKGLVDRETYIEIMRSWSSFSAVDINNDNELDIDELKTLIWVLEDQEPDERRIQQELKLIDEDGGGTVDRLEFISYLMSPAGEGSGYYDFNVKKMFDQFDINKDGFIDKDEFYIILKSTFEDIVREKTKDG